MLVAICYCDKDLDQAQRLADWLRILGPYKNHNLLVGRDASTNEEPFAEVGFAEVETIVITDDIWRSWPESCNNAFQAIARHVQFNLGECPFLWLEPDVVPMRHGWIDAIEEEYAKCGKPFLGDFVSVHTPEIDVVDHMSGVAVYTGKMVQNAGIALMAHDLAWDVYAVHQIMPKMARSKLIHHAWKHPAFTSLHQVQREIYDFKPQCVLFHASKDGSLIRLLSAAAHGGAGDLHTGLSHGLSPDGSLSPFETVAASDPVVDILVKSYPKDYEFLQYCLQSIEKYATGFRQVILILPDMAGEEQIALPYVGDAKIVKVLEHGDGYMYQQTVKANSHEFTDSDYILHIDSDTIFTQPVSPQMFFREGKPAWMKTSYASIEEGMQKALAENPNLDRGLGVLEWRKYTEKFLGEKPDYEFMRRMPMFIPRWVHELTARFCLQKHGVRLSDYIMAQPNRNFSEFNALGAVAHNLRPDSIYWLDTEKEPLPEMVCLQAWSWGGLTDEVKAKFEAVLNFASGKNGNVEGDSKTTAHSYSPDLVSTTKEIAPPQTKRQLAAAKARAVLAEKRKLGTVKRKKKRKVLIRGNNN